MKKILLILLLLSACDEAAEYKKNKKLEKEKQAKAKQQEIIFEDKDAVKYLTEYGKNNTETLLLIKTKFGNMKLKLYEDTPLHRANFLYLTKREFFNHTVFYRVIKDFMIQGGGTDNKNPININKYYIPAEIMPEKYFHKRGALAMARDEDHKNPTKKSSSHDFFIVQGMKYTEAELKEIEKKYKIKIPASRREIYKTWGGEPHLDGQYTTFGEVLEGFEVIDKIASVEKDKGDWPLEDIKIEIEVIKN